MVDWDDARVRVELRRLRDGVSLLKPSAAARLGYAEVVWAGAPVHGGEPSALVLPPLPAVPRGIDEIGIELERPGERTTLILHADDFERAVGLGARPLVPLEPLEAGASLVIDVSVARRVSVARASAVGR